MRYNAKDLKPTLQKWANKLGNRARKYAPKHLKKMIHSHLEFKSESNFQISLTTDPPGGDAENIGGKVGGDIFGREFGAGVHGGRGHTYPIPPRNKKVLSFFWEKAEPRLLRSRKFYGRSKDGRLMFNYVDHPGYKSWNGGKGFLRVAFDQIQKEIEEDDEMSRKMTRIATDAIDSGILEMNTKGGFNVRIR